MISIFALYKLIDTIFSKTRHSYFSRSSHGIKRVFARDDCDSKNAKLFAWQQNNRDNRILLFESMKRKESDLSFNWRQFTTLQKKIVFNNKSFFSHPRFSDINTPQSSSREYKSIHKNTNARHSFRNKI